MYVLFFFTGKIHDANLCLILNFLQAPPEDVKPIYLQYAKLDEDYGLAKRAMKVYDQAVKAVPNSEKLNMYEIYIARAAQIFGIPKTREIYEVGIFFFLSWMLYVLFLI